jgi:uncharacterized protein YwqG
MGRDGLPNLTREDVLSRLTAAGVPDVQQVAPLLRQTVWLRPDPQREPELLPSRFGGPAMVPADFEWPYYDAEPYQGSETADDGTFTIRYGAKTRAPLFLFAQINLAEVPLATELPPAGLLSFFIDPFDGVWGHARSDRQGFRILYAPAEQLASLRPLEMPARDGLTGAFAGREWRQHAMTFFLKWTLSDWRWLHELEDREPWSDGPERIREAWGEIAGYGFGHFLLDAGLNHQGDPRESAVLTVDPPKPPDEDAGYEESDAYRAELDRRAAEWTTLFSVTKDEHLNLVAGDTGGLSFLIRKSDLAARRFDAGWVVRS